MALVKCGECGREISDQAHACPGCGAPMRAPSPPVYVPPPQGVTNSVRVERAGLKYELWGFLMIVAGMIIAAAGGGLFGGAILFIGLWVFLVGRFIN